jgi:dimethylglycine dehydrogenase
MRTHARIVIVGGGIMGVGLLYHLAEEGAKDLLLIEKGELTSGSTWHAAGQCPSLVGDFNLAKIHHHGNTLYPRLEELTGQYTSWHGCGGIRLARTREDIDWFKYMGGFADDIGFRMQIIGPDEIRKIHPFLELDGVLAGAWTLDDGHADPAGLTFAMAKGATNMGAEIMRHNRVTDLVQLPSGEWDVVTEKGTVRAEIVVNAAGVFARNIMQMLGRDLPISNMEHHYLVTGPVAEFVDRDEEVPVVRDPYAHCYLRQEQKSGLIGVYERENMVQAWAPTGMPDWESDSELFPENYDRIMPWLERALERIPSWADAGIKRVVNGAIPHTTDGPPLLGPEPGLPNFWQACGASFGIAQGAGCGKYLAQWILYGDSEINMSSFDPRRFGGYVNEDFRIARAFQDYGYTYTTTYPGEELPAGRDVRTGPLHDKLKAMGCVHAVTNGWERPKWFSLDGREEKYSRRRNNVFDVVGEECKAVQERVGLMDFTGFSKFEVSGPDSYSFLNRICANRIATKDGGVALTHTLSENGRIFGEMTVTRLAEDHFYVLSAALAEIRDFDHFEKSVNDNEDVKITNVTEDRGVLVVAGPRSRELLAGLTDVSLENDAFPWLSAQEITLAGVSVRALRVNYVGELGWELHPRIEDMETVYDAVWEAGQPLGVANFGLYAVNSLRIEKAYHGWGSDLTNEINMLEAGMSRFIRFEKGDFTGKQATLIDQKDGLKWEMIYFEVDATDSDIRGAEPIFAGDECIGITTSGGYGYRSSKSLGFGTVRVGSRDENTQMEVKLLGERHALRTFSMPAYDPDNARLKS